MAGYCFLNASFAAVETWEVFKVCDWENALKPVHNSNAINAFFILVFLKVL
jgi:hypothetical protein